jgi:Arc/MetJ-type ribon-helix-helix transcriptional regulator
MMTSIYFTQENEEKVGRCVASGRFKGKSDVVNRALEVFFMYMEDPHQQVFLLELEAWLQERKYNINMFNTNTNVPNMNTNMFNMNTNMLEKPVTNMPNMNTNMFTENTNMFKMNTNVTQPTQVQAEDPIKTTLQPELPMIQRVLNNLANNDTIPDDTLKMLSKKYDLKKPAIQAWIVENKKWIKDADFTEG